MNELFQQLGACEDAMLAHGNQSTQEAWDTCERSDWMLWLAARQYGKPGWPDQKALVKIACECARASLGFCTAGDDRPLKAIEAAEMWLNEPSEANRLSCESAAWSAARSAASAAESAASAARSAAESAAESAASAAESAASAAWSAARSAQCKMIRQVWPKVG